MRLASTVAMIVICSSFPALADDAPLDLVDRGVGPSLIQLGQGGLAGTSGLTLAKWHAQGMTTTHEGVVVAGELGLTDRLQLGAGFSMLLRDNTAMLPDAERTVAVHASYLAHDDGELKIAALAEVADDLRGDELATTAGVVVQRKLGDRVAIYTPGGQVLVTNANDLTKVGLVLPVGAAYQATPRTYLFAHTELAQIGLANLPDAFWIADFLPVTAGAFFSPARRIDLGLVIDDDLETARDYSALAMIRLFGV